MKGMILTAMACLVAGLLQAQVNHQGTTTNQINSSALGMGCSATGYAAFASGLSSQSSGTGGHAFGMNAQASGLYSLSAGSVASSPGSYSMALGNYVKASGSKSIVIGSGYANQTLTNHKANSLMVGFNSDLPTFYVSSAAGPGTLGKVGIGTSSPQARLEVDAGTEDALVVRNHNAANSTAGIRYISNNPNSTALMLIQNGDTSLRIDANGMMRSNNTLIAKEVKVRLDVWKDEVFSEDYPRLSLDSLARFIAENRHLPGIPPEKEILGTDVDLGQLCVALLGKLEEMTLYILELRQQNLCFHDKISQFNPPNPNLLRQ
jgi:hypothetical protein